VAHRRLPDVALVHRRRAPQLDPLGVHRLPQRRHVVFPADGRAHPAERRIEDGNGRAVALPPDQPFAGRRHQLAVLAEEFAVRPEEQHRAIKRAAVALDRAGDEMRPHPRRER